MSCEACKRQTSQCLSGRSVEHLSDFYANLLLGMHAMAQPLTLLQSHFYVGQAGITSPRSKQLTLDAAAGAEQLCMLLRLMQECVQLQSVPADKSLISLESVLATLREDAEAILAGTGTRLTLESESGQAEPWSGWPASEARQPGIASSPMTLAMDPARTRQALVSTMHILKEVEAGFPDQLPGSTEPRLG